MPKIERSTTINASAEKAYNYLIDVSKHAEWGAHNLEVTRVGDGAIGVGTKFETVGHQFGAQPGTVTITELVPNQKIVYESDGKVGHFRHQFTIADTGDGAVRVSKGFDLLQVRSLPLKVLGPIVRRFVAPKGLDGDLARIKAKLETA